ncbi:MAG: 3-isopropylmalate dehydrogenase [Verrucomicrobia bacterium]|nr:3-isopropylmalate dehydrogenase [Verrucomicrobiota bacterium]
MNLKTPEPPARTPARLISFLLGENTGQPEVAGIERPIIGVFEGTGIGPEVIAASLRVLGAVEQVTGMRFEIRPGGAIAEASEASSGRALPEAAVSFCAGVFAVGGAVLSGPGGGRYVYDLRRRFDLFCKFVPVRPWPEIADAGCLRPEHFEGLDLLIVRDNVGGIYQGSGHRRETAEGWTAEHCFSYTEAQVRRLVEVAARAAAARRGRLHLIVKDGGVTEMSAFWREIGLAAAEPFGVRAVAMNADLAAYELVRRPAQFDVLVAPNMIGDILADIAGVLVTSRGVTFSGNYSGNGSGVYQTNHGCAHDLAGTDTANPAGQILSLAMLLRESFGLDRASELIQQALRRAWKAGWRTADVAAPGCRVVGTRAMTQRVVDQILEPSP